MATVGGRLYNLIHIPKFGRVGSATHELGGHELIFMTAKHDKLSDLSVENMQIEAELLRSSGLAHNPNQATAIFRHVTYVALSILQQI